MIQYVNRKNVATRGPEARLYSSMFACLLFPAAMFIYAWCTFPWVHWISLAIGITVSHTSALTGYVHYILTKPPPASHMESIHNLPSRVHIPCGLVSTLITFLGSYSLSPFSSYGPFASSALAGQSLSRNIMGTVFPLFTTQMYNSLTYKWANTLFACIGLLMIPIPFVRQSLPCLTCWG